MLIVPLKAVPSQSLLSVLDGQSIQLDIFEKQSGLFANIWLDNVVVLAGVLCQNLNQLVRDAYLGLAGDFVFRDTNASARPHEWRHRRYRPRRRGSRTRAA